MLSLTIDGGPLHAPGAVLPVRLAWDLTDEVHGRGGDCTAIAVRLCRLVVAGTHRQVHIAAEHLLPAPSLRGSASVAFTLPAGPWSAAGRLGRLTWLVEAVALPRRIPARAEFVLAAQAQAVDLTGGEVRTRSLSTGWPVVG